MRDIFYLGLQKLKIFRKQLKEILKNGLLFSILVRKQVRRWFELSNKCAVYVRVSTDDQRDNGYSIDSQLRMIKEYCEKNDYLIVDVYNDAGHSGKDLMRPEMQRLLKDIKTHKIEKIVAIKVDRLTRNNYDGFWLLNYCEQHDVKIELILEPYDVSTANGEMIFGMNVVFG